MPSGDQLRSEKPSGDFVSSILRVLLLLHVVEEQPLVLVVVGDELAVRRRHGVPAQHLGVLRQLLAASPTPLAGSVQSSTSPRLVGQGDQRLSSGRKRASR